MPGNQHVRGAGRIEQRMYEHILSSLQNSDRYGKRAKEMAARTVLKQHKLKHHRKGKWQPGKEHHDESDSNKPSAAHPSALVHPAAASDPGEEGAGAVTGHRRIVAGQGTPVLCKH